MAVYETQFVYTLSGTPLNFTAGDRVSANLFGSNEQPATTSFSPGDQIALFATLPYAGFFGNGYILQNGSNYILYSNDASIASPFVMSTGVFPVCFLAGTAIAMEAGARPVETLAIGDLVLTADGRSVPVRWVGVQTVVSFFADRLRAFPVRIVAGALGEGLPARDLSVSADHALMLDGVLVQAGALVNGTTIVRETAMPERFTYYHLELEDHALILAEGVPAETFVDNVTRRRFDNFTEYEALYGQTAVAITEMDAPRVKSARQLPQALRERLSARATALAAAAA